MLNKISCEKETSKVRKGQWLSLIAFSKPISERIGMPNYLKNKSLLLQKKPIPK